MKHSGNIVRTCTVIVSMVCWSALAAGAALTPQIVGEINTISYTNYLDNQLYAHNGNSRAIGQPDHDAARANIKTAFESFGLTTTLDPFSYNSTTYYNVVAEKPGVGHPDQVYIIGAHYDSYSGSGAAPGADDNASGVAAVLEAARVMSQYQFEATLRFIAFDREEQGLIGSTAYANAHSSNDIRGMISMDMVAYNPAAAPNKAYVYYDNDVLVPPAITNALATAFSTYSGGISTTIAKLGYNGSDHAPFAHNGFDAALVIEHEYNPNYHSPSDSVDTANYIDYTYATNMTRGAVGYLSDAAVAVPEPSSLLMLAVGGLLLLNRRRAAA